MNASFVASLFCRMESERWPAAESFPDDKAIAAGVNMRPEVFWRLVTEQIGSAVVWRALKAGGIGGPNRNHQRIAALLECGRCRVAATTNFDEHIERCISKGIDVRVPTASLQIPVSSRPLYLKLHGTVSDGPSLSFTLEHYDQLSSRAPVLAELMGRHALIIAGYSGYDTDVLPALEIAAASAPLVLIVRHPGSPENQPILGLGSAFAHVYTMEIPASEVLEGLAAGLPQAEIPAQDDSTVTAEEMYYDAIRAVHPPQLPLLLARVFSNSGHWPLVRKYAWLAHDASDDSRYRTDLGEEDFRKIHQAIAYALKLAGDDDGGRIMLGEARASLEARGGSISEGMLLFGTQALMQDAPNRMSAEASEEIGKSSRKPFKASEVLAAVLGFTRKTPRDRFLAGWQVGIARRREQDSACAVTALENAMAVLLQDKCASRIEEGRFLLDYAGATFDEGVNNESSESLGRAMQLYSFCEHASQQTGDWPTNAQAHLMLAKCEVLREDLQVARAHAKSAMESAQRTGDTALRTRIADFACFVEELDGASGAQDAEL